LTIYETFGITLGLKSLECVWIEYFNEAIHFFEEFIFLCNEILCLDREIKKHFKCKYFFEGFQLAKLVEIQIPSK